jgi:hypothetical protein
LIRWLGLRQPRLLEVPTVHAARKWVNVVVQLALGFIQRMAAREHEVSLLKQLRLASQ